VSIIDGLDRAAFIAGTWAETAQHAAGETAAQVLGVITKLLTPQEFAALESHFVAKAYARLELTFRSEGDNEKTEPTTAPTCPECGRALPRCRHCPRKQSG